MEWSLVTEARDPVEKCPFELKAVVITEPEPVCPAAYSPGAGDQSACCLSGAQTRPSSLHQRLKPKSHLLPKPEVLPTPQATNPGAAPGNSSTALEGRRFKCSLLKMTLVIIYLYF